MLSHVVSFVVFVSASLFGLINFHDSFRDKALQSGLRQVVGGYEVRRKVFV